jgi:NitT/TauT family transport system substrate-binding protein
MLPTLAVLTMLLPLASCSEGEENTVSPAAPLRIGYSDWPGWVMWEIAREKGFFEANGVPVEMVWMDYVPSMEAFAAGQLDAVSMTNGDAMVTSSQSGKQSIGIIVNDYSNGNDMVIGRPGINSMADLRGKKIGVEVGFVDHLLLLKALEANGMTEDDVELVNMATNELPQALASGAVEAIAAWQPNSGQALKSVPGSKSLYSSADQPGLIYDMLFVTPESLASRNADWEKVVRTWYQVVDFLMDPANREEAVRILASRVNLPPEEYAPLLEGTKVLTVEEALRALSEDVGAGLSSIAGSNAAVDAFNLQYEVYTTSQAATAGFDSSLTSAVGAAMSAAR